MEPNECEHTHAHEHAHEHGHAHEEGHAHLHAHDTPVDGEQAAAVLRYMLDHNIHHTQELSDLAGQFNEEIQHEILHAVEAYDQGNGFLSAALNRLR